ncbi:hypothetical protein [Microbulbifer sp. A4B17]|uniref:hypothetical protein n=1 Tax=Microbulbifer sp. A4B17 TaxID=359370 RepID=UPI0013007353|nr:hypothetical protein [Microbulbifer sp. A4B17]
MKFLNVSFFSTVMVAGLMLSSLAVTALECGDTITTAEVLSEELLCNVIPALLVVGPAGRLTMARRGIECSGGNIDIILVRTGAFVTGEKINDYSIGVLTSENGFHSISDIEIEDSGSFGIQLVS